MSIAIIATFLPALLAAFGLGTVATTVVQALLAQRARLDDRQFQEKQAAYVGLLEAYHRCAVEGTEDAAKAFAYWQMRCELVGAEPVILAIRRIVETNDDRPAREVAHTAMQLAMRVDLGVAK